jgi:predicted PurR-regulated permease PerM
MEVPRPLSAGGNAAAAAAAGSAYYVSSHYVTLALYAGGQLLALAAALLLWLCWSVLESFSEPLLWAYLCSLSLRDVKRWLVRCRCQCIAPGALSCCA